MTATITFDAAQLAAMRAHVLALLLLGGALYFALSVITSIRDIVHEADK